MKVIKDTSGQTVELGRQGVLEHGCWFAVFFCRVVLVPPKCFCRGVLPYLPSEKSLTVLESRGTQGRVKVSASFEPIENGARC